MKRKLQIISLLFVIFSLQLKAQCPLNTAVDFTATDIHGQEIKLFDILDGGQYVLIDFFYTTCGPCNQVAPHVKEAYERLGCNQHEVFFMEISVSDNDAVCTNWVNKYGIEYPTISTDGGGKTINSQYKIGAYPTVILIAPDRKIVIKDLFPISNSSTIVNALKPFGIQEHECGGSSINNEVANTFRVYPNPASDVIFVEGDVANITIYNSLGQIVKTIVNNGQIDVRSFDNGIYYLTLTSLDKSRRVEKIVIAK